MKRGTEEQIQYWSRILFGLYLILLVYFLLFSEEWGRTFLDGEYRYNLIPFQEIQRYILYRKQIGGFRVALNLGGNVVGFLPFGALLPVIFQKKKGFIRTALSAFELSLLIELIQLVCKVGSCDVDDILLNTLGGCIGYGICWSIQIHRRSKEHVEEKENSVYR